MQWENWVLLIFLGVVALLCVLLLIAPPLFVSIVAFIVSLRVVQRVRPAVQLKDHELDGVSKRFEQVAVDAEEVGFNYVGDFQKRGATLETQFRAYFGEGNQVILLLPRTERSRGYRFATRLNNDVWMMTGDVLADAELSHLRDTSQLPDAPMCLVLHYHQDRVAAADAAPVPLAPETIIDDMYVHERLCAERNVELGYARWKNQDKQDYVMTLKGAANTAVRVFAIYARLKKDRERAERYRQMHGATGNPA